MAQGLTNQIVNSVPAMRMVVIYSRKPQKAIHVLNYAGLENPIEATRKASWMMRSATGSRSLLRMRCWSRIRSRWIIIVDTTGSVEFGAHVLLEAFKHGKDVVLMNAELDATIGPILQTYADKHGVILSACEGDEPGLQMNLYRWVKGLGLTPRVMGNVKGLQDPYRNPTYAKRLCREVGTKSGDGDQLCRRIKNQLRAGDRGQRDWHGCEITRHVPGRLSTKTT